MELISTTALAAVLALAAAIDLRTQRIPNLLTFPAALFFLALAFATGGADGLLTAGKGLLVGFGLLIVPYALGIMGAGDVKLLAVVGAALGPTGILTAFLLTCLAGGVYALVVLARNAQLIRPVFSRIWTTIQIFAATKKFSYAPLAAEPGADGSAALPRLCYGVAIAVGSMGYVAWRIAENGLA